MATAFCLLLFILGIYKDIFISYIFMWMLCKTKFQYIIATKVANVEISKDIVDDNSDYFSCCNFNF